ncbi:hypothetical protein AGLY_002691 [Aphis glycines]|uniref:Uncharacterized protein n=1 Tax=Aphis glycines TaxID=307491 RepID=A0A6G0U1W8_APHGL|nr:hypothetical protein AGLY_002691 [Aphis glycines]
MYNSERSDECIDFTMMCVFFFVSVYNIWSSKNASIFEFSPSLKSKLNLVGTLGGQKLKINLTFQYFLNESGKTLKKMKEKRDFLYKTSFCQNRFFFFAITQKLIDGLKFEFIRNMSKLGKFARNFVVGKSFSINFSSNICKKNSTGFRQKKFMSNLNFGVFQSLKHKPPFSPTTGNYILG